VSVDKPYLIGLLNHVVFRLYKRALSLGDFQKRYPVKRVANFMAIVCGQKYGT